MIPGQRFNIDLDKDELELNDPIPPQQSPFPWVGDVLERTPKAPAPPTAPSLRSKTGFPEHKKRTVPSRFKQKQGSAAGTTVSTPKNPAPSASNATPPASAPASSADPPKSFEHVQRDQIDAQNRDVLASMSEAEIEEARQELMGSLDPDVLQKLLRRSHIESGSNETSENLRPAPEPIEGGILRREQPAKAKSVAFSEDVPTAKVGEKAEEPAEAEVVVEHEPDFPHAQQGEDGHVHDESCSHPSTGVHFPTPSQPPSLDPNSETFLTDLHEKYFPDLPQDPSKLEWMQPSSNDSSYSPNASALNPCDLRFDFTGALLPPNLSSQIPTSAGLHHHASAPNSAGYTIPELAHLSHSSYASQRCIAFQTLGRILYRLGRGEFGDPGEPGQNLVGAEETFGELARGLWREFERLGVVEGLIRESEGKGVDGGRHVSAKAYATEAVWLWQRGGGRRWKAD